MSDSSFLLDYKLGWRWLLPKIKAGSPCTVIADDASSEFLLTAFALRPQISKNEKPQLVVIDADFANKNRMNFYPEAVTGADTIAIYGTSRAVSHVAKHMRLDHSKFRDYGLIPPSSPRIVIPLGNQFSTLSGLGLHRPGRMVARLAVMTLKVLARFGFVWPLKRARLIIRVRDSARPALLENVNGIAVEGHDFALYLGVAGQVRKTVSLPVGDFPPEWIVKSAELPAAREKLANEARILKYLQKSALSPHIPKLIDYQAGNTSSILVQQYLQKKLPVASNHDRALTSFLESAAQLLNEKNVTLGAYIDEYISPTEENNCLLSNEQRSSLTRITAELRNRFSNLAIPLGLVHGDFAPWNYGKIGETLVVYDWEDARLDGIAMSDAFSNSVLPDILVHGIRDPGRIASRALDFSYQVYRGRHAPDHFRVFFALWSLSHLNGDFVDLYLDMANTALSLEIEN